MNSNQDISVFKTMVINILFFQNADIYSIAGALWLLVSIFIVECGICIMKRIISSDKIILLCLIILGVFATVYTCFIPYSIPFTLDSSFTGAVFYFIAFIMRTKGVFEFVLNKVGNIRVYI